MPQETKFMTQSLTFYIPSHQKSNRFESMKTLLLLTVVVFGTTSITEAGLFSRNRSTGRQQDTRGPVSSSQSFNPDTSANNQTGRPLTRIGERRVERKHAQDLKVAERTGQSWQDVEEKRVRRINTFVTILGAAGSGLSGAAEGMNYSRPTVGPTQSGLRSNFLGSSRMDAFNRTYSINPDHAPVTGR